MAGLDPGRIVSTFIDFPGLSGQFQGKVYSYALKKKVENKPRRGRGTTTKYPLVRPLTAGGSLVVTLKLMMGAFPEPSVFYQQQGSCQLTYQTDSAGNPTVYQTVPVRVDSVGHDFGQAKDGTYNMTVGCTVVGTPAFFGFGGTQPGSSDPTKTDQEQWEGTNKVFDPQGLLTAADQLFDVWGSLANTDAAELQRIASVIAAVTDPPQPYLKVKTAVFNRDSDDGGTVTIHWSLTDSAEDVVNPRTTTTLDATNLESEASAATINAQPSTPTGDAFVKWSQTVNELNDHHTLYDTKYRLLNPQQAIEFPGTVKNDEQSDLQQQATVTSVTGSSTPPTTPTAPLGLLVEIESVQINAVPRWRHTFKYANTTAAQRITFDGSSIEDDPSDLADEYRETQITGSSTAPATPTPTPSDLVLRRRLSQRIGGTPEQWKHTFQFGRRSTQQDVEMDGTITSDDTSDLNDSGTITSVTNSATPAAPPAAPTANCKFLRNAIRQLHPTRWAHTYYYGPKTTRDEVEMAGTNAVANGFDAGRYRTATVVDSAFTAATLAASYLATYKGFTTFERVEVRPLKDGKLEVALVTRDDQIVVTFEMRTSGKILIPAYLDSGNVYVFVRQVIQVTDGQWSFELAPNFTDVESRMRFSIRRRVSGDTLPMHWELSGTSNASDFLGLAAGFVGYLGIAGQTNISIPTPRVSEIVYEFDYDTIGQFDLGDASMGWHDTDQDLTAVQTSLDPSGSGWVKASDLGFSSAPLTGANYAAAFLS